MTFAPTNGLDRCDCGCKYWEAVWPAGGGSHQWQCLDCGTAYSHTTEGIARSLFEADPSSKWEADWQHLAPYKRDDWIRLAEIT